MDRVIQGRAVVAGKAAGEVLASAEPLSFWGGYDHHSGRIIDRRHPLDGQTAAGRVLAVPAARGSSTTTAVLLEAVRAGTAPAALITPETEAFFALASVVAQEMYERSIPVIVISPGDFDGLRSGEWAEVNDDGTIRLGQRSSGQ